MLFYCFFFSLVFAFFFVFFFFFQAEDGIRDKLVTGVQTCALPILNPGGCPPVIRAMRRLFVTLLATAIAAPAAAQTDSRPAFAVATIKKNISGDADRKSVV